MRFPESPVQTNGLAIGSDSSGQVATGVQGDAQVVVGIGIIGIADQRLIEGMNGSAILPVGEQTEAEELIRLGVSWIHAEGGAGFGDGIGRVIKAVEDVGQSAVVLGKIRHKLRGKRDLVDGVVPALLLAEHGAQSEVQRSILRIEARGLAQSEFGLVEALSMGIGGGLQQDCGNLQDCGTGRGGGFQVADHADQTCIRAGGFKLTNLFLAGEVRNSVLLYDTDEAAARHTGRQPGYQLHGVNRLACTRRGSENRPKNDQKN